MKLMKFDVVDFLDNEETLIEYLNAALSENDPAFFAKALGDVARAKGMTSIADATSLGRQSLYKALSSDGNPRIDTLFKVLDTLNVRLAARRRRACPRRSGSQLRVSPARVPLGAARYLGLTSAWPNSARTPSPPRQ